MLLTPHTLVGVALGASIPYPEIAVPISLISHFLGDLVPHWDFYSNTTKEQRIDGWRPIAVMGDFGLGIGIGLFFTLYALWVVGDSALALNIFMCGIAAVLPDALTAPSLFIGKTNFFLDIIGKIQSKLQFQAPLPWGIITQILVSAFASLMILNSLVL